MLDYIESSIIIPVFNQWDMTRACLKSLAATIGDKAIEVIVVDNASSDATPQGCTHLGKQLFGSAFRYHRSSTNLNFGPASNIGARMAKGKFLIFLNNDTVPLPGWYQPLIDDFAIWPDIAATGPLLLYPESSPFGHTVQHLGVFISPALKMGHLYEGIPAVCPLAKKRRFFQIITAACMVIRRSLFIESGLFDENYINGFEDVDLCLRLFSQGYRMTINPEAKVIHHTSQTPGRHRHEVTNSQYLMSRWQSQLAPDWHLHLKNDGLALYVGQWQTFQASLPPNRSINLDQLAANVSYNDLKELLARHPFWDNGWRSLVGKGEQEGRPMADQIALQNFWFKLYPSPEGARGLYKAAFAARNREKIALWVNTLAAFCKPFEEYVSVAKNMHRWCADIGMDEIASQYSAWLAGAEAFKTEHYLPFLKDFWPIAREHLPMQPHKNWAYTLWNYNVDLPRRKLQTDIADKEYQSKFSILMPVYNPKPEHLVAALESVIAQTYSHWELCIADDASTDSAVRIILTRYAQKDARIHVCWRQNNGHIAAATNTALEMAQHPYAALMDQDDILTPDALLMMAKAITNCPDGLLFYSDEDKIHDEGFTFYPHFKNGRWDWELLNGQNFVNHLSVYQTTRMKDVGGFREGFRGAQDFDLLLRYTAGVDAAQLIHIPYVLYHWRAHVGSTALDIGSKSEVIGSAVKAVQSQLDLFTPGATARTLPDSQFLRVEFPLPEKRPLVSLICNMGNNLGLLEEQLSALTTNTTYGKYEIFFLASEASPKEFTAKALRTLSSHKNIHLILHEAQLAPAERLMLATRKAHGQILGFFAAGVTPITNSWLEEMVSCLWRSDVGAVGGRLLRRNGTLVHAGYLADASGLIRPVLQELLGNAPGWFSWGKLARTVDALDDLCIFTRTATLTEVGGFKTSLGYATVPDYCLRLRGKKLRCVWWPFAEFMLTESSILHTHSSWVADHTFIELWGSRLTPFNENLTALKADWELNKNYSPNKASNICDTVSSIESLQEDTNKMLRAELMALIDESYYYSLYPDVKNSGMSAFDHFMSYGFAEGRNPNSEFDIAFYKKQFPELNKTHENPILHYILKGKNRGALYKKPEILLRNYSRKYEQLRDAALPKTSVRLLAWYLPQFHPIAENNIAWRAGFTEWSAVASASPRFSEHYQPRLPGALGFYDLRRKETMQEQIDLAKHAGVYGFILHHYWFNGRGVLRAPLENLRKTPDLDVPFCLCWANESWTRRWDGSTQDVIIEQHHSALDDLDFLRDISWALRDKRYIRFQGKPMLGIYRPGLLPDVSATLQRWRDSCIAEGIGEIFLFSVLSFENTPSLSKQFGFDGTIEFPPFGISTKNIASRIKDIDYSGAVYSYKDAKEYFIKNTSRPSCTAQFRGVMPGWDNSARSDTGKLFVEASPEEYRSWLINALELTQEDVYPGEKYIAINAWNEWAEGAYLEPDADQGFALLNATSQAISRSTELSHVLFICDTEDGEPASLVEEILKINKSNPIFHPVLFTPDPVHSIGTFKGLAPQICSLLHADKDAIRKIFAASGYLKFDLGIVISNKITSEAIQCISEMCSVIVFHDKFSSLMGYTLNTERVWSVEKTCHQLVQWQLRNAASNKITSLGVLLHQMINVFRDHVEISVIALPSNSEQKFMGVIEQSLEQVPYRMEAIVPCTWRGLCHQSLSSVRRVPATTELSYMITAIMQAKGEYIWLVDLENFVDPVVPRLLRPPFVDNTVNCAILLSNHEKQWMSVFCKKDTIKLHGRDFIRYHAKKSGNYSLKCANMLFRKSALMAVLQSKEKQKDSSLESFILNVCESSYMAIVP